MSRFMPEPDPTVDYSGTDALSVAYGDEITAATRTDEVASASYAARTSYTEPNSPVCLVGYDPDRARVLVQNNDATFALIVGPYASINVGQGFAILPSKSVEFFTQAEIWAVPGRDTGGAFPTAPVACSIWSESNR